MGGLQWLDDLVKAGRAIAITEGGYPTRYTATANHILPTLLGWPPQANDVWVRGPEDIIDESWEGTTVVNRVAIEKCKPDEWLLIETWDES